MGAEGALGAEGAKGVEGAEGADGAGGAEEDDGAAICILLDGQDTTGIGYMAFWGFGAKCGVDWMGDTPQTVRTTRAPAVLKINQSRIEWGLQNGMYGSMVINGNVMAKGY